MKKLTNILALASVVLSMTSCDDLWEPANENIQTAEQGSKFNQYFDGILLNSYILMPYSNTPVNDVATDDAVSNDVDNTWREIAGGAWTSQTGVSVDNWRDRNASIQYSNLVLSLVDGVEFSGDPAINKVFRDRIAGEAYALRALNMYFLLQNYGGYADGELLGAQIFTEPWDASVDMNRPRNTFAECMQQLLLDVDSATTLLPYIYKDINSANEMPARYKGVDVGTFNRVFGSQTHGRITGQVAQAIRAQAALLAASPAFADQSGVTWEQAANFAGKLIADNGGVASLDPNGHKWYTAELVGNDVPQTTNQAEIIWRSTAGSNSDAEKNNFPPSLYGNGRVNPTQNLVDAFPMANGYPITDARSGYDKSNPYDNRDPRLDLYIVHNGSTQGRDKATIYTGADSPNNDGINQEDGYSTRTGYYMRKLLREDVSPNPTSTTNQQHYTAYIRFTEIFLAYAEAANEAWGPTGNGSNGFSAYDVIKAIRQRAGLAQGGTDAYLENAKGSKETMRELIRNERRIELCFENKRFWDLRRWKADLRQPANGVSITNNTKFDYIKVEDRNYQDYMIYGPIPYGDIIKFSNLQQNQGW